jgi:hypothetical protein
MKTNTLLLRNGRLAMLISLLLAWFALSPTLQAVSPPPDGGYAGSNTAEGTDALFGLTTGVWNSAFGFRALYNNTMGIRNTAVGYQALYNNTGTSNVTGKDNVAIGPNALFNNTTGNRNIAIGPFALLDNTTGSDNIAIGNRALWHFTGSGATAIGDSFYSDANDVEIGRRRGCQVDISATAKINAYDIFIGHPEFVGGVPGSCNTYAQGTQSVHIVVDEFTGTGVFVGGVAHHPIAGLPVVIDDRSGQLGVQASSVRFKQDIESMGTASEAILALKPVSFHYKKNLDPNGTTQFGLVAEEVEKVNPSLITRDRDGKPYTVRYDAVNAMLLNEFLKEHKKVEDLQAAVAQLTARVKEQDSKMQKLSEQLNMSKALDQVALNQK